MEKRGTSDERLAAICQMIRNETLDPAKEEAEQIKHAAERDAARVRAEAKQHSEHMLHDARTLLREEREAFDASLEQASRQVIALLKEKIEQSLFTPTLDSYLSSEFKDEHKTAALLDLLMQQLDSEGINGDLAVWLGKHLSKEVIVQQLGQEALKKISNEALHIGNHNYGFTLKILNRHLSIEITPEGIKEMLSTFLRPDFRAFLFKE
jgi:V/A-type H+-transporting ATPase subunit E